MVKFLEIPAFLIGWTVVWVLVVMCVGIITGLVIIKLKWPHCPRCYTMESLALILNRWKYGWDNKHYCTKCNTAYWYQEWTSYGSNPQEYSSQVVSLKYNVMVCLIGITSMLVLLCIVGGITGVAIVTVLIKSGIGCAVYLLTGIAVITVMHGIGLFSYVGRVLKYIRRCIFTNWWINQILSKRQSLLHNIITKSY